MPTDFNGAASAFHPAWGIIMSGGSDFSLPGDPADVTTTKDAKEFESLAPMPDNSMEHCIAAINANMIFATGLGESEDLSFMYSKETGVWSPMPNMPTRRTKLGCGVVRDGGGKPEVVVVGGYDPSAISPFKDVVEIFSVEDETWRTGTTSLIETFLKCNVTFLCILQAETLSQLIYLPQLLLKLKILFILSAALRNTKWIPFTALRAATKAGN